MTALLVLGAHRAPVWVFLCGVLAGAHNLVFAMAPSLLCQRRARQAVLGRVFAFRRSFVVTAQFVSLVLMTLAAQITGPARVVVAGGVAAALLALPPSLRALRCARAESAREDDRSSLVP